MTSFLPVVKKAIQTCRDSGNWRIHAGEDSSPGWIHVVHTEPTQDQGWKLHLSANGLSAHETLRRALPVLLSDTASFKVTASGGELSDLNEGHGGLSQVGKFVTVYPNDDAQAVRLAVALDRATQGLHGPPIPSDRPLRASSLVHYRYGGFADLFYQSPIGQIIPALRTPAGELVPDERRSRYSPPDWVTDPFLAAGIAGDLPTLGRILGGRYLIVVTLHESPRGAILSAVDVLTPRTCVIKQAHPHALVGRQGRDACDRLRHEMKILSRLAPDDRFPQVLDLIEQDDDLFLVMSEIEGVTVEQYVRQLGAQGQCPPAEQLLNWARELARALGSIHDRGIIYRDLKSPNIIVGDDGHLRMVDFELACEIGSELADGRGTRGYSSPQQVEDQTPTVADDIYGLGALLFFAATGAEPSLAPHQFRLLDRPVTLLNPEVPGGMVRIIERCLDPDTKQRFLSMAAVEEALAEVAAEEAAEIPVIQFAPQQPVDANLDDEDHYRRLATRLADTLCGVARSAPGGDGLSWRSTHEGPNGISARDLSIGSAGPVFALTGLVSELGHANHRDVLLRAAHSLAESQPSRDALLPGLYVGEAGVGAALLRAGQVLGDDDLIASALDKGRLIASIPYVSPDIFNGTAGRLRFHLWLWAHTSDPEQLRYAKQAGAQLLESAEGSKETGVWWTIPPGYGGLSGFAYFGYAHGAAGIADTLLDLFEVTGDEALLVAARRTGEWITHHAIQTLTDASGLDWPDYPGGSSIGPFWCHGAAGVGQFLLHAAQLRMGPDALHLALRAARSAARGARWSAPTQCHGLAGNIEFLLDVFQTTRDPDYLDEARQLGRLLQTFAIESNGLLVWPSESPGMVTPDYTVGYAGVASCLLRLSAPERLPRQLSGHGLSGDFGVRNPNLDASVIPI